MATGSNALLSQPRSWSALAQFALQSAILALGLALVLTLQLLPSRYNFKEGDVVTFNIKSPYKVSYISQLATRSEREKAAAAVPEQTVFDSGAANQQLRRADEVLRQMTEVRRQGVSADQKLRALNSIPSLNLNNEAARDAVTMDDQSWTLTSVEIKRVLSLTMSDRFTQEQVKDVVRRLPALVEPQFSGDRRALIVETVVALLRPTVLVDQEATIAAREAARAAVQPVRVTVEKGEIILRDGDVVKALDIEKLEAVGLSSPTVNWSDVLGNSLLAGLVSLTLAGYLYLFQPATWASSRRLMLVYAVVLTALLAAKLTIPGRELLAYAFPVAAVPMLLATLIDVHLAVLAIALFAPLVAVVGGGSFELGTVALFGGLVGLAGVWRMERQSQAFLAGLAVAVASFLAVLSFRLWFGDVEPGQIGLLALACFANGGVSAVLTLGASSILGHIFGVTTTAGLLELAHPSQPLFRRLLADAPGTYHHSVVVANLAERAAQQVGADSLLTRVGAYYHDIGKVARPYCFVENQVDGQNIHDKLNPQMSAKLVSSHVKDGLQLAKQHSLPSKVRDIIEQHHGTKLAKYFYHQACRDGCEGSAVEEDFRYPGPRPQTKEAALVMLADAVEAAVRAAEDPSPEAIARIVNRIVNETVLEGQLNECDLSLRDVQAAKEAFVSVLQGIFHPRIKYPEAEGAEITTAPEAPAKTAEANAPDAAVALVAEPGTAAKGTVEVPDKE